MKSTEFLDLAKKLLSKDSPANIRTAISRSYYAVHHFGSKALSDMGFHINEGPSGHGDVWNRFLNSGNSEIKSVGSSLATLHSHRRKADYKLEDKEIETLNTAKFQVILAEQALGKMKKTLKGTNKENIIPAIKTWEKNVGV
jgi:uncharacterized protein (UPF0332 family)